jgi:predicted AlkP superfamily phosphohydrolase/phosphomutase
MQVTPIAQVNMQMKRRTFMKLVAAAAMVASGVMSGATRLLSPLQALARAPARGVRKVLCLGLDGMDPDLLQQFMAEGVLPNFKRLTTSGDFRVCGTSIPPQSPVAWSNFITGQNPGGHGIFDFIHRKPDTLLPMLSLAETRPPARFIHLGKWKLPRTGGQVALLRQGKAFWEYLAAAGLDVTVFKMPANFPPVTSKVRSIAGMGAPDILGTYGIFGYYTDDPPAKTDIGGGRIIPVNLQDHRFTATITGPGNSYQDGDPVTSVSFEVVVDPVHPVAKIQVGDTCLILQEGEWSDWVTLHFAMIPHLKEVTGICRFYLMEVRPSFRLYVSPVQIDPANPAMPICTPPEYSRELVENTGPFYTQGLPDDTKALDEGVFQDKDYIEQADLVLNERLRQYRYELDRFQSLERGFLFFYFNSLDQNCHMFWRNMDPDSPLHADSGGSYGDRVRNLYIAMDRVLGEAMTAIDQHTVLFAVSDHGFAPYHRSFHVNTWLLENGYLSLQSGRQREDVAYLRGIDWRRTRAYALGINAVYLNLRGREKHGVVHTGAEREQLLAELVKKLEAVVDPQTGEQPVKYAYRADRVYTGDCAGMAPDLILGYRRGYRGSNESALGEIAPTQFADNLKKWSGDHCMAADEVPGILVCSRKISRTEVSLLDMAPTFLRLFGLEPAPDMVGHDIFA